VTGHFCGGEGITDLILQRFAFAACSLQQGAVVDFGFDRKRWPADFVFPGAVLITAAQRRDEASISPDSMPSSFWRTP
jgi:hypothetical protein